MAKQFNKIGVTSEGYRGNRAILDQRVIEGLGRAAFIGSVCRLEQDCPQTIYLDSDNNSAEGNYIILPDATSLWPNWKLTVINDSQYPVSIYYYTEDGLNLNLFKEVEDGNMTTLILLDDTTQEGKWTYLRTTERVNAEAIDRFTTNVFETLSVSFEQLQDAGDSELSISLANITAGTSVKSIYVKPTAQFVGATSLTVSIGVPSNRQRILPNFDLTGTIADNYFSRDLIDDMISTTADTTVYAYFNGVGKANLTSGSVDIIIERTKLIDPTVLKNPIVQTQVPLGVIMNYGFTDTPYGFKRLDGLPIENANSVIPQFVERLTRANNEAVGEKLIVSWTEWQNIDRQYGSCGKFAWRGSDLVFPKIGCFIQGLTDINQMAKLTPAGLPNITGTFDAPDFTDDVTAPNATGAFYYYRGNYRDSNNGSSRGFALGLDASRSSPIYGNSTTVQPLSIKYPYIISIYSKVQTASEFYIDELIQHKADISLNNLNNVGLMNIANGITPDFNKQQTRTIGVTYTADVPGLLVVTSYNYATTTTITINEHSFTFGIGWSDHNQTVFDIFPIYIGVGDTYSFTGGAWGSAAGYFFPLRNVSHLVS